MFSPVLSTHVQVNSALTCDLIYRRQTHPHWILPYGKNARCNCTRIELFDGMCRQIDDVSGDYLLFDSPLTLLRENRKGKLSLHKHDKWLECTSGPQKTVTGKSVTEQRQGTFDVLLSNYY